MGDDDEIKTADPNNKKLVGGCDIKDEVVGNTVCSATATKWCTEKIQECTGMATPDATALAACVKDMVKIGNTASGKEKTFKLACQVVKEGTTTRVFFFFGFWFVIQFVIQHNTGLFLETLVRLFLTFFFLFLLTFFNFLRRHRF